MFPRFALILLALLILGIPTPADTGSKKDGRSSKKNGHASSEVEIKLADGSTVRVDLLQETIQVVTKFGPLQVPTGEIRKIEFGIHLSEQTRAQIDHALKMLSSDDFKQREAASQTLITLGSAAYPALFAAQKSSDPDRAKRVQETLKAIRLRVPANMLKLRVSDQVHTAEFPILGRITSPALKVRTAYFGERELAITDLLSLRAVGGMAESEVTIDAARYGIAGQWMDPNIELSGDTPLEITADGKVDLQPGGGVQTGPAGWQQGGRQQGRPGQVPQFPGTLMGRIGENGKEFVIGERHSSRTSEPGKLYLHIVPSPWGMSVGEYKVKVVLNGPG